MKTLESIDYWYHLINGEKDDFLEKKMFNSLKKEYPAICSLIMQRTCNLNCPHCFFQSEKSSRHISELSKLKEKIIQITSQMTPNSFVIHEGRILENWHIPILKAIRENRPDIKIGLIDNGSFLLNKEALEKTNFLFNWMDISIDGTEKIHNKQRQNQKSFQTAINGLIGAKKYLTPDGKTTSLFTATKINCRNLAETASYLAENKLIEELHITPASQVHSKSPDIIMDTNDWKDFWKQLKKAKKIAEKNGIKIYLKFYKIEDLSKLAECIGEKFFDFLSNPKEILVDRGNISFLVYNIRILYIPLSLCPSETFVIDADGKYRLPYCIEYTLEELNSKKDKSGKDISFYTVGKINKKSSFRNLYKTGVKKWIENFAKKELKKEITFFTKKMYTNN